MMTSSTTEGAARKGTYMYWSSAYFIAVATLYLWGYWSVFDINILEHVGLADIAKTAAYPIASAFVFVAIGAVLGEVLFPTDSFPPGGGADTRVGKWLHRAAPYLAAIYLVAVVLIFFLGPSSKWRALPILIAIPVAYAIKRAGFLKEWSASDSTRTVVAFLVAALPPFAFGHGQLKALGIKNGDAYLYVPSPIDGLSGPMNIESAQRPRYLGQAGHTVLLFVPTDGSIVLTTVEHVKTLHLVPHDTQPAAERGRPRSGQPSASAPTPVASCHFSPQSSHLALGVIRPVE